MAAKTLMHNVLVWRGLEVVALLAGTKVPDWAEDQLTSPHLFTVEEVEAVPSTGGPGKLPNPPKRPEEPEEELEVPSAGASVATWRKFAKHHDIEIPSKASRDEIIEAVRAAMPDIEIETKED